MVWRRYRFESMWLEMEEMRAELDHLFQKYAAGNQLLLPGSIGIRMIPVIRGEFRVDVRDHEDEVIVVADLPGVEKEAVTLSLSNPRALEITCKRNQEKEDKAEGYCCPRTGIRLHAPDHCAARRCHGGQFPGRFFLIRGPGRDPENVKRVAKDPHPDRMIPGVFFFTDVF